MRTFQLPRSGAAGLPESVVHLICGSCLLVTWWLASGPQLQAQETQTTAGGTPTVDFQRDVRPILSDTCYKCHGPDEQDREAGLRLDTQDGILESGAVVAGDLEASELFHRIASDDPDLLMPPPDSGRQLTEAQRQTLRRWIEQGAQWQQHWSLVPPTKPNVPAVEPSDWCRNPIDHFILQRVATRTTPTSTGSRSSHLDSTSHVGLDRPATGCILAGEIRLVRTRRLVRSLSRPVAGQPGVRRTHGSVLAGRCSLW